MRLRFILPMTYVLLSVGMLVAFGNIGHGNGLELFYYISLPSGAISNVVERSLRSGEWALLYCFVAGLIQYSLQVFDRPFGSENAQE